jgi:mediator of RNA polymerase II transcription subunit 14
MLASLQKELNNQTLHTVQSHLQNFSRTNPPIGGRCSIFPAIQDLLLNLSLPNEGPTFLGPGPPGMPGSMMN